MGSPASQGQKLFQPSICESPYVFGTSARAGGMSVLHGVSKLDRYGLRTDCGTPLCPHAPLCPPAYPWGRTTMVVVSEAEVPAVSVTLTVMVAVVVVGAGVQTVRVVVADDKVPSEADH